MFIITWLFDKLGYMPKIKVEVGALAAWPFPVETEKSKIQGKKPAVKKTRELLSKATTAKAAAKKTTRKPKAK